MCVFCCIFSSAFLTNFCSLENQCFPNCIVSKSEIQHRNVVTLRNRPRESGSGTFSMPAICLHLFYCIWSFSCDFFSSPVDREAASLTYIVTLYWKAQRDCIELHHHDNPVVQKNLWSTERHKEPFFSTNLWQPLYLSWCFLSSRYFFYCPHLNMYINLWNKSPTDGLIHTLEQM